MSNTDNNSHAAVTGILLTNLGTPDAPTAEAVKRYLAEFLMDPRVIDYPRLLWWPILHGIILRKRPPKVAHAYESIWTDDGSPLLHTTRLQARALFNALHPHFKGKLHIEVGMRYGNPSITSALDRLKQQGVSRIFILPLYPQYSTTTTASSYDAVNAALSHWDPAPEQRTVQEYHNHPAYIQALADSVHSYREQHGQGEKLLFSFHGLPQRYVDKGDPYAAQCKITAELVARQLQLTTDEWQLSFQSRFGPAQWLQPYTDKTLEQWGQQGIQRVDIISPGFAADCLETLEELAVENRDLFLQAGGKEYHYIPCLNDHPTHIALLAKLVLQNCRDWVDGE